ncbi:MAG: L-glutamate gamma-semialdehyde dehydrogenase [Planctomycetota bacterium]
MNNTVHRYEPPANEPICMYTPDSAETASLKSTLSTMAAETIEIPCIVGGKEIHTGKTHECTSPHDHQRVLGHWHAATPEVVQQAIDSSQEAWKQWSETPYATRMAIFTKAAELLAGPWRDRINASTMLGQSKTCFQAEIDAACELIDFFRFNAYFALNNVYNDQPFSAPGMWNTVDHRPLEGFVFALTPFNFTSIAGNLSAAPALMGNVALWKPSSTAVLSNYYLMKLMEEAGLPPGVINFLPGSGREITSTVLESPHFAGLHFTGSTAVFQGLWQQIAEGLPRFRSYPRIVGETGGKDFIFAHESADMAALATATVRGAFEYQGQKCSAASRLYIPRKMWPTFRDEVAAQIGTIKMGDPSDFSNFMCAVIDEKAYNKITGYIENARSSSDAEIIAGGEASRETGWFIQPTFIECKTPNFPTMCEEIFGPVVSAYVYDEDDLEGAIDLCDNGSPYALTGAVFSQDRYMADHISKRLRHAAGNFYINDKPTGAVVGQQPFGGARASGTDDKAGSALNLMRWVAQRTIKETFNPPIDYRYPHMG